LPFVGAAKGALTCLLLVQEKEEFSENIIQDVAALGISYEKLTHTSDYFPEMLDLAERLIKKGYIYADDTPLEQMREVNVVSAFSPLMTCNEHAQGHCACSLQLEGCHQNGMENSDSKPRLLCRYLLLETAASTSDTEKKLQQESQLPIKLGGWLTWCSWCRSEWSFSCTLVREVAQQHGAVPALPLSLALATPGEPAFLQVLEMFHKSQNSKQLLQLFRSL